MSFKYNKYIDSYMRDLRSGKLPAGRKILKSLELVENKLQDPDVYIDHEKIEKAKEVIERWMNLKLVNWQLYILSLVHCFYKSRDAVVFKEFFIMMGRGNGKNGFISALIWYFSSPAHGINNYNVDIVANSENQAKTSFLDVHEMLTDHWDHMKKGYTKTKQEINCLATNSYIKYNTANARTKDGLRPSCIIFDEIHEYETRELMNVFTSAFGKNKHQRIFYITTNGYCRGGVLDAELEQAENILEGNYDDYGYLPMIYELDDEKEANNKDLWVKANPSLPFEPFNTNLREAMDTDWVKAQYEHSTWVEFYTKRMNIPKQDELATVATWENILKTNREFNLNDFEGCDCIGGVDFAQIKDFCSVGLLFRKENVVYFHEHTFVNRRALRVKSRPIKFPVEEMAEKGLITIINEPTIEAEHIAEWFLEQSKRFNIKNIIGDSFRMNYLREAFEVRGLPFDTIRRGAYTHALYAPRVESLFANGLVVFGDNPTMRWYVNNVYLEIDKKGNTEFKKIEPQTRKTDGFFSFLHALSGEEEIQEEDFLDIGILTF